MDLRFGYSEVNRRHLHSISKKNNYSDMSHQSIQSVGEFGLISLIQKWIPKSKRAIYGVGDDAAVLPLSGSRYQLLTVDTIVEDMDFEIRKARASEIGWKALAINLSDIAAMGGEARFAVVSLVLPSKTSLRFVRQFYEGMSRLARRFDVEIVGGDLSRGPKIICSLALLGEADKKVVTYRDRVEIGDLICVTGPLGGSILGKHLRFLPRLKEGQFLAQNGISAMIDISDGLISDLHHLVSKRRLGFVLEGNNIPISRAAQTLAHSSGKRALWHALYDGEDFELLFTVRHRKFGALLKKWDQRFGSSLSVVGQIVRSIRKWPLERSRLGYQHF